MITAARVIDLANQIAKVRGFASQALDNLNAVLGDLCQEQDLALARQVFTFNFDPGLATLFGSGPYPLPLDYLRTSGSSGAEGVTRAAWFLYPAPAFPAGQPMPLVPIDLGEYDQYPQLPAQGIPSTIATDMGGPLTSRTVLTTTAQLTAGNTTIVLDPVVLGVAQGFEAGIAVAGEGIVPGTTVVSVASPNVVLSVAPTATNIRASVFFGIAPVCYIYPPPVGPYPCTIRYQRMMPSITDLTQVPWFPNEGYLIDELAGRMALLSGDGRANELMARAARRLGKYLGLSDDKTNRAQTVQLDARRYGHGAGQSLKITKVAGWLVLLTFALAGITGVPIC